MNGGLTIPEDQVNTLNYALEMLDISISEFRRVANNLIPESLMRRGLNPAINDFCLSFDKVYYRFYGIEKRLDEKFEVAVFRIVNELVRNALEHANANKINVQLIQEPGRICLTVQDDGCGFDCSSMEYKKNREIGSVELKVVSFNGKLDVYSAPGKGAEITVEFKF